MSHRIHLLVTYSVRNECIAQVKDAIISSFDELTKIPVENLFYSVYQVGSNSFIHLQCFPSEAASNYIFSLSSFQDFFQLVERSFKDVPMTYEVENLGYYNSLGR